MTHPSSWGDEEFDTPNGEGSEQVAGGQPPEVTHGLAPSPSPLPENFGAISGGSLQELLPAVLTTQRPRSRSWGDFATQADIHLSLLHRLRKGVGSLRSFDHVAKKLGWTVTIRWK